MRNFFVTIYRFFERHRIALWAFIGVLLTVFVFGILRLRFVEDISSFFPNQGDNQRVNYAYQHIGADNRILLNVKLSHPKDSLSEVNTWSIMDFFCIPFKLFRRNPLKKGENL